MSVIVRNTDTAKKVFEYALDICKCACVVVVFVSPYFWQLKNQCLRTP